MAVHPGDDDERQADRVAERLLRLPAPDLAPDAGGPVRPAATHPPDGAGRPLPAATRALIEGRLGHDFGHVRVHTDGRAAESASSMDALAYTVGRSVVFAAGQYEPHTARGQRLLAHELAHVVQQAARPGATPRPQRKKARAVALWYQEAVDRLKVAEKDELIPLAGPMLRKFVALAKAVDEEDAVAVPGLLRDFTGGDAYSLPPLFPFDPLAAELIARLLLLGLRDEAERFRVWQLNQPRRTPMRSTRIKEYFEEVGLWERILERMLARVPTTDPDAAAEALDGLALLFEQLRDEAVGLDPKAVKADLDRRKATASLEGAPAEMSISMYSEQLEEYLRQTFAAIQACYQLVLDRAVADLGAAKGDRYLQVAREKLRRLDALVLPKDPSKATGGVQLPVTRTEFKKRRGRHLDILAKGKAAAKRTVKVEFYDVELGETDVAEKQLDFARVLTIRQRQLQLVERLFGLERDKGKATAETKENAAAIAKLGRKGLRLHSDDDWRKFLVEKFELHRAQSGKAAALTAVIQLLEAYLRAFTTHTPYNIEDFGDNVLTRTFPRALTGQLIHDCGVYALRIAYMLSLLREHRDLRLRFRYILLPVHIGLIITGNDLPTYIAHNDQITVFPAEQIEGDEGLRQRWRRTDPQGDPRVPSRKDETPQFLGELAGTLFIPGVDLPFKLFDVPHLRGGPAAMKRRLWQFYTAAVRTELFGPQTRDPKSPHFQFHLRYLQVLEMTKTHFNTWVVPFWEAAHRTWLTQGPELTAAWQRLQAATTSQQRTEAERRYDSLAGRYRPVIVKALDEVIAARGPIATAELEIGAYLDEHPEVLAARIPRTRSPRQHAVFGSLREWEDAVWDHLTAIGQRQKPDPPFARAEDLLSPID